MERLTCESVNKAIAHTGLHLKRPLNSTVYNCGVIQLYGANDEVVDTIYANRLNHFTLNDWIQIAECNIKAACK